MKQYRAEKAAPNPRSTVNSYRSFGYNLSTAIADIIDNSLSANASEIHLNYKWIGKDSYVTITDNGNGMDLKDLIIAMTPGSKDPDLVRHKDDLGRFGMGLKTASFSQCKRLTVATKKENNLFHRCWDIDFINEEQEWILLDFISDERLIEKISSANKGTVVIWEKLDRIVGNSDIYNEAVKAAFYHEFALVRDHVALVFHKFIEQKKVKIYLNDIEIVAWNPFLLNLEPKPQGSTTETLKGKVEVTYYILPHMSRIPSLDYEKSGGPLGWYQQQGFYIYRGSRLLVGGDWLGIEKKREYSKLARISIDFPNASDFDWNLDIKKSTATPPVDIRKDLQRIARVAIRKSASIYNWRGQIPQGVTRNNSFSITQLWNEEVTRENVKKYRINRKHPALITALEQNKNKRIVERVLKLIEDNIPLDLILYNQNEDPSQHEIEKITEIPSDDLIKLAIELYHMNVEQGVPRELACQQIMSAIPFNLFPLIKDYLK